MKKKSVTKILNVSISAINYEQALRTISGWINTNQHQYICVSAVHLIMECQKNKKLLKGVNRAGLVTPDGMPLVWISKLQGRKVERVYGPTLMHKVCAQAQRNGWRIFLVGGAIGQSQQLQVTLEKRFPQISIVGHADTPIRPLPRTKNAKLIDAINMSKAQVVFVGLGCPFQELWMIDHQSRLSANILIGVGAAFDFMVGKVAQAPTWMRSSGLEWFFRLLQDPKRLWKRYTVTNLHFLSLLTKDYLSNLVKSSI